MLDKTVPNFHVIMKRRAGLPIAMHVLPSGFSIVFWLNLFVMGLTNCTVIVTFGWGVTGANSGFCHGHSRFGGGHGLSPYTKRESQPLGLILRCSRGHGSTDFGGSRVG